LQHKAKLFSAACKAAGKTTVIKLLHKKGQPVDHQRFNSA
jgi:hypothetical protein